LMLQQFAKGHEVDLPNSPKSSGAIRASFLWKILTSSERRSEGNRITIFGGVVEEDRYTNYEVGDKRSNLTIPLEINFQDTVFEGVFSCVHCNFKGGLHFVDVGFLRGVDLSESQIDGDLFVSGRIEDLPDSVIPIKAYETHVTGQFYFAPKTSMDNFEEIILQGATAEEIHIFLPNKSNFQSLNLALSKTTETTIVADDSTVDNLYLDRAVVKELLTLGIDAQNVEFYSSSFGNVRWIVRSFPRKVDLEDLGFKSLYVAKLAPPSTASQEGPGTAEKRIDVTKSFLESATFSHPHLSSTNRS
jgi:hypothetical protein